MKTLTAKTRISIGLACLVVSVLCTAMMIGLVPERSSAVLEGRAAICETIAMASSDYISKGELRRLECLLQSVVDRSEDILSAGVRRSNGQMVTIIGEHNAIWKSASGERSTDSQVSVPIRAGKDKWGSVELCFLPLGTSGITSWFSTPWVRLTAFVSGVCYLLFLVYLKKMLSHLDPSKSVPRHVRSALDSLAEGLLVIDTNQRIVLANQSFAAWVGRDAEKLIGVNAGKLNWLKNEAGEAVDTYPWVEALRLEAPQAGVMLALQRKDQPIRTLIANASPVLGHDGKYRGVLVSFDDVTLLEETKKDLHVAKRVAEDANQAKSEFLARMSHEIRTPMNAILGYTDVLRRGFDQSVQDRHEYLNTIHTSGEHLLALINDILDLSKIESGKMELELQRCSPHQLISQVVTLLHSKADEKGITLEFVCDGLLPETILVDAVRLRQAIVNLAGNAIKFTQTGGVTIKAKLAEHALSKAPMLAIDVIDTGIGIPKSAQSRVFEPFAQADTSVTRKFGGTGLGLAISKQLAESMGGGIAITSEEGCGSTFTLSILVGPLDGIVMVDALSDIKSADRVEAAASEVIQLPQAKILVADDGESNRKLIDLVLRRAGVEVVLVENGQLAVERALQNPFDVILMDMQMPVMDGYTATATLREHGYELPIIALTAHAMQGDEEKCRSAGCSGFLTKPIKIDVLLATLRDVLTDRSAANLASNRVNSIQEVFSSDQTTLDDLSEISQLVSTAVKEPRVKEQPIEPIEQSGPLNTDREPIRCGFPLDDPDFLEIAQEFVERFRQKLSQMCDACIANDYAQLSSLAHWLKGSGGTAGFDVFTQPAHELEQAAAAQDRHKGRSIIETLVKMSSRIELSAPENNSTSAHKALALVSSLPLDDIDFFEIVAEFVERLASKLDEMEQAWRDGNYRRLTELAHWLKGSGGTAGFDAFTEPAHRLGQCAAHCEQETTRLIITEIRQFAARIELTKQEPRAEKNLKTPAELLTHNLELNG